MPLPTLADHLDFHPAVCFVRMTLVLEVLREAMKTMRDQVEVVPLVRVEAGVLVEVVRLKTEYSPGRTCIIMI